MAKENSIDKKPDELVAELVPLLNRFEEQSADTRLRERVLALVPVYRSVLALGPSLFPSELKANARGRLLHYFREYPLTALAREELAVVGGIGEWARRVRELRVEYGWSIVSGITAKEMASEGEWGLPEIDPAKLRKDDYVLTSLIQDKEAAFRWHTAKEIKGRPGAARDKMLAYLRANVGTPVSGEELRYIADISEWARRVRELRTELGWPVVTKQTGRKDLPGGVYLLEADRQASPHDRKISDDDRLTVLRRDDFRCRRCGWSQAEYSRALPRHLELHHIRKHALRGENTPDNLITLCTACHDIWHSKEDQFGEAGFMNWLAA